MAESKALVDTNVLLDILTDDPTWADWSAMVLAQQIDNGQPLVINQLVLAELSVRYESSAEVDRALGPLGLVREQLPFEAAHPAARAFAQYRRRGGSRSSVLPDFYIGAHAQVMGHILITRDARRYRTAFADLEIISPEGPDFQK